MKIENWGSLPESPGFSWIVFTEKINGQTYSDGMWYPNDLFGDTCYINALKYSHFDSPSGHSHAQSLKAFKIGSQTPAASGASFQTPQPIIPAVENIAISKLNLLVIRQWYIIRKYKYFSLHLACVNSSQILFLINLIRLNVILSED
jgi:hypothetical protein